MLYKASTTIASSIMLDRSVIMLSVSLFVRAKKIARPDSKEGKRSPCQKISVNHV